MVDEAEFAGHVIHFKHVYRPGIEEWGVLGFPASQPADAAGRRYRLGDPVLLAIPKRPEPIDGEVAPEELHGRIFAVCTLAVMAVTDIREIANQETVRLYPDVVARWPTALPVVRLWWLSEPFDYSSFGEGEMSELASTHRGQLIRVPPQIEPEVRSWLESAIRTERAVAHAPRVTAFLRAAGVLR